MSNKTTAVSILPIDTIGIGMILNESIFTDDGFLLLPKDTILTESHLNKLKNYGINRLSILNQTTKSISEEQLIFNSLYNENRTNLILSFRDMLNGKSVNLNNLYSLSKSLTDKYTVRRDLFNHLFNLKAYDDYTYSHCYSVSILCNVFSHWLNMSDNDAKDLTIAGILHDIGKMQIDSDLINKTAALTDDEFNTIKGHCQLGYDLLKNLDIPDRIKKAILLHHEKCDGSGYPNGYKGSEIPDFAKIISIVDIYDALTSNRSYRKKYCPFKVIKMFESNYFNTLDTKYLLTFLENIAQNYIGCQVYLSNGDIGEIVFISSKKPSEPIININGDLIDLSTKSDISIVDLI